MFGLFRKSTLTLAQRAALMTTIIHASLIAYVRHHEWLSGEMRADVAKRWFERNGGSLGMLDATRISVLANDMARWMSSTMSFGDLEHVLAALDNAQGRSPLEIDDLTTKVEVMALMKECEKMLIKRNLAS